MGIRSTAELKPAQPLSAFEHFRQMAQKQEKPASNPLTVDDLQALKQKFGLDKPTSTPAAIETMPALLHPTLQAMLDEINTPAFREMQTVKELESLHDRSSLWPLTRLRDVVLSMNIQLFVAREIPTELRQRLGMAADTAAAADTERRWIIVDLNALSKGCSQVNVHPTAGLAAAILHECGHIQLGHKGSDRLTLPERLSRESLAWGYGELMISQHNLHCYCQPYSLRKMERFALSTYFEAA